LGLADTVKWYQEHPEWCERVLNNSYQEYYAKQYGA